MRMKRYDLCYNLILFSIIVGFFINDNKVSAVVTLISVVVLAVMTQRGMKFKFSTVLIIVVCSFLVLLGFYIKGSSMLYTAIRYVFLIALFIIVNNGFLEKEHFKTNWFYYALMCMMLLSVLLSLYKRTEYAGNFYFGMNRDKNYSAIIVFMFFMYCNKKGKIAGIVFAFAYALFLNESRSYLGLLILFYLFLIFKDRIYNVMCKIRLNKTLVLFVVLFAITAFFTMYWVTNVTMSKVVAYHTGFIDLANMERFVGNYRALEMIQSDDSIRIWGYGSDYSTAIGMDVYTVYKGVHLQPAHNSLFNPLVRMGLVVGVVYLVIVSGLIDHFFTKENLPYIIPYIINAMFVHSMFEGVWLVFWLIIIATKQKEFNRIDLKLRMMLNHRNRKGTINILKEPY